MAPDVRGKHSRHVLSRKGGRAAHEAGQFNHQCRFGELGYAQSDPAGLRDDQGRHAEFHRWSRPNAREKDIRVNAVAPGPTWTPLIPSTMPEDAEALG